MLKYPPDAARLSERPSRTIIEKSDMNQPARSGNLPTIKVHVGRVPKFAQRCLDRHSLVIGHCDSISVSSIKRNTAEWDLRLHECLLDEVAIRTHSVDDPTRSSHPGKDDPFGSR